MIGVRRALAGGWAPSVSIGLHAAVLMAALFLFSHPMPPVSGEKPIPISLVMPPAPSPLPPPREPVVAREPEPPPALVASTAETAPVAPPIKKPVKKVVPKAGHEPAPEQRVHEPAAEPSAPTDVAAEPSAPIRSAEPAGPPPSYLALLRQKLERNKIYPRAARQRRQEGTAILRFVISRDGHVVSLHVEKSTGYGELDREVEAMLERAQPFPPMPAEMNQAQLEIAVPVDFHLR